MIPKFESFVNESSDNKKLAQKIMDEFVSAGWTSNAKHVDEIKDLIDKIAKLIK